MIELNLTYQESKKILELGYDFSKVCREFELHRYGMFLKKIKLTNDCFALLDNEDSEEFAAELDYTNLGSVLIDKFIPIIPKAALEACLPREIELDDLDLLKYVMDSYESLSYSRILPSISGECLKYEVPKQGMFFNSAFEAFLWVHEYYPEELKAKFDEVMG